ncbi:MAG: hypothetical protein WDZ50_01025 [Woeseia sp.]
MKRSAEVSFTGLCGALLMASAIAEVPATGVAGEEPAALHILTKPVKHTLKGPQPFEEPDLFGFPTLGFAVGSVGAIVAGYVVDNALGRMGNEPDASDLQKIDVDFDFRKALLDGIHGLASPDFRIAEIHEVDYGQSKQATARQLFKTTDADYAAYFEPTWFVATGLDQVRLIVDVDLYSKRERSKGLRDVFSRRYEFLSPSRGTLFRAFRPGEKEDLIAEIETHFDQKSERYPRNVKSYDKDRKRALKAIEKRSVIFPPMAMSEGWPEG